MKNLHVIPTSKPSRLIIYSVLLNWFKLLDEPISDWKRTKHIYITSDEEIKVNDIVIDLETNDIFISKGKMLCNEFIKKIIITTDQDLIRDGVQAIDIEFIEWFIKNTSCDEIQVEKTFEDYTIVGGKSDEIYYKIILPKKEDMRQIGSSETVARKIVENTITDFDNKRVIPLDAYDIEVFRIESDEYGKLFAYIGYKITNGNFHFNIVPYTEPEKYRESFTLNQIEEFLDYRLGLNGNPPNEIGFKDWFELFKKR